MTKEDIKQGIWELADAKYGDFKKPLLPCVEADRIIGVRIPILRKYSGQVAKDPEAAKAFLEELPHQYLEENHLHGMLIRRLYKTLDTYLPELERFLPYIDNWEVCDLMSPQVFPKDPERVYRHIKTWLRSTHTYTIRFGIDTLLFSFLDQNFKEEMLEEVAGIQSSEYYVQMAMAWYFSMALVKHYDLTLPYLQENRLDKFVHNKSIQKARESYQISDETKNILKAMKR